MALIGEMYYLTIGGNTYSIPTSGGSTVTIERALTSGTKSATISVDGTSYDLYAPTPNAGTVTSVRVQATSPVQSSTSTAQSSTLNTTISLANGYGDTKNPYASKTKNYVLAAPATENGVPSFRALVAADIPDLSDTYLTSYTETDPIFSASAASGITSTDITNWNSKTSNTGTVTQVTAGTGLKIGSATSGGNITTSGTINHINSVTAQTTQAVYPIKIDAQGHISGYGSAVTSMPASDVSAWAKAPTKPTYTASEVGAYTTGEVDALIEGLPEPMIFKGSLGTGGTITSLPTAAASNEGYTYKVITAGTYASQSAKVGDTFISDGSTWVLIPSGDEPSGTVTSVTLNSGTGISVSNGGIAITTSGSRTISLASITKDDTTSTASPSYGGDFTAIDSITYDTYGRVTGVNTKTVTLPADSNTDTKVSTAAVTSGTTYYPVVGSDTTSAATKFYDKTGITYTGTNGTTSVIGNARLTLGNSTASGTANNKQGVLRLYSSSTGYGELVQAAVSSSVSVTHTFPAKNGTVALTSDIPSIPTSTENATTGITASTTATKTTLGTASSIYGVGSTTTTASKASGGNGTAPSWVFEEVSIPNVTAAGSASTWTFEEKTIPNVTAAGSASTWTFGATTVGDGTLVGTVDSSDSSMLVITAGTKSVQQKTGGGNGTAPTLGTAIKVQSKSGGSNGTAPTIGTAIKVQSKKSGSNGSASTWSFTDVTVPIKNSSATSVPNVSVTSATVSITDPGHTHTI